MFVKLTKMDGSPLWVNAAYVVTVEPSRTGGAVVVPLGDGLDYDVRETPEAVIQMVAGDAPAPKRTKRATSKKAKDGDGEEQEAESAEAKPEAEPTDEPKPAAAKKSAPARKAKPKAKAEPEEEPKPAADAPSVFPEAEGGGDFALPDADVERLRKFAPKSLRKLYNTLMAQFGVTDPKSVSMYLVHKGVIAIDKTHVNWISEPVVGTVSY